jgi:hypothetical protein
MEDKTEPAVFRRIGVYRNCDRVTIHFDKAYRNYAFCDSFVSLSFSGRKRHKTQPQSHQITKFH